MYIKLHRKIITRLVYSVVIISFFYFVYITINAEEVIWITRCADESLTTRYNIEWKLNRFSYYNVPLLSMIHHTKSYWKKNLVISCCLFIHLIWKILMHVWVYCFDLLFMLNTYHWPICRNFKHKSNALEIVNYYKIYVIYKKRTKCFFNSLLSSNSYVCGYITRRLLQNSSIGVVYL